MNARTASTFLFRHYAFAAATGALRLDYGYDDGTAFTETIVFPAASRALTAGAQAALDQAFRLIFLLAGVSYYKARLPNRLECPAFPLDPVTAAFVANVYLHGLGEFAYQNKLDLNGAIHFVTQPVAAPQPQRLDLPQRLCVPVGGGKDSIVTLEALKQAGRPVTLFALGSRAGVADPIKNTIAVSGLPSLQVTRSLSPRLFELNKTGAYNGHVPITAILSAIAVAAAILQGLDTIVMSNEHSASAPNLRSGGRDINHQYSKSLGFERDFAACIHRHISPDLGYFSLLRPLSEVAITRRFARHENYFPVFRSCNAAFRQDESRRHKNWCGDCPKCRFVFLALAPFIAKPQLISIFGKNMLDDPAQQQGFAELCGLAAFKPFECVGEVEESALLMQHLAQLPDWKTAHVVAALAPQFTSGDTGAAYDALFRLRPDHRVPPQYLPLLAETAAQESQHEQRRSV